jgi:hypothetical protein
MEMLRRNLFFMICGLGGLAGIVLGAAGVKSMTQVKRQMNEAVTLYAQLQGLTRGPDGGPPANAKAIEAEQQRIQAINNEYDEVMRLADQHSAHTPLTENFFPRPKDSHVRNQFLSAYREALNGLLQKLHAGTVPTLEEIAAEEERIREEESDTEALFGLDDTREESSRDRDAGASSPSGLVTEAEARLSPEVRASIKKAKSIYCYADLLSSLDVNPVVWQARGVPPALGDCWDAQVSLWVQQDVIDALARVNDQAAAALQEAGETPWVGNLPVKDLISIRLSKGDFGPYVVPEATGTDPASPGGVDPACPPGSPRFAFTGDASGPEYELIQFTVKLVVDARDLPVIINELCRNNFTTLLRIAYVEEPANLAMEGKIYGDEPAVNVVMDFETCLFSKLYLDLMPDEILKSVGKVRPQPPPAG